MKIFVTPSVPFEILKKLEQVGKEFELLALPTDTDSLDFPETTVVLWSPPIDEIINSFTSSEGPSEAVNSWVTWHSEFISLLRRYRQKIILVDATALFEGAPAVAKETAKQFLNLHELETPEKSRSEEPGVIKMVLAQSYFRSLETVQTQLDELEASSHGLSAIPRTVDELSDFALALTSVKQLDKELSLIEHLKKEVDVLSKEIAAQKEIAISAEKLASRKSEDIANLHSEIDRMTHEIHELRCLADERERQVVNVSSETASIAEKLSACQQEVNSLYSSSSWKITKPLRSIKLMFR